MADTVPFLTPWGAPTASAAASTEPVFLAPAVMGGLPFLAPQGVPELVRAPVLSHGAMAYFAPPLMNGLRFLAPPVFVDVLLVLPQAVNGGGRRSSARRASSSRAKSSPAPAATHYHSRSDEQEIERLAAQLDDEEIVLSFLMEFACV